MVAESTVCVETIYASVGAGALEAKARDCPRMRWGPPARPAGPLPQPAPRPTSLPVPGVVTDRAEPGQWEPTTSSAGPTAWR